MNLFAIEAAADEKGSYPHRVKGVGRGFASIAYESFSDVGEIRVYFASKILTPCRMH